MVAPALQIGQCRIAAGAQRLQAALGTHQPCQVPISRQFQCCNRISRAVEFCKGWIVCQIQTGNLIVRAVQMKKFWIAGYIQLRDLIVPADQSLKCRIR